MMNTYSRLLSCGLIAAITSPALAQTPQEVLQGPASGLANGVILRSSGKDIRVNAPGAQTTQPATWASLAPGGTVDYSHAALFGNHAPDVEIDAVSTGNDVIPPLHAVIDPVTNQPTEVPDMTQVGRWLGVVISVKKGSPGATNSSLIQRASANGRNNGADLFAYYFEGSTGIASEVAGETLVEQTRESMGYTAASNEDISGLDFALGVRAFNPGVTNDPLFPVYNQFYFSITPNSASTLGTNWLAGGVAADCRTIYRLDWMPGIGWSGPSIHRTPTQLNLAANEDLDALAVDPVHNTVVYSKVHMSGMTTGEQLMIHDSNFGAVPVPLRDVNFVEASDGLGVGSTSDIDAICILDPAHNEYSYHFGTPVGFAGLVPQDPPMGLSVTYVGDPLNPVDSDSLRVQLSGRRGTLGANSTVIFLHSPNYDPDQAWDRNLWQTLAFVPRMDSGSNFDNVFDYAIPAVPGDTDTGEYLGLTAIVLDPMGNIIGSSLVSVIRLQ